MGRKVKKEKDKPVIESGSDVQTNMQSDVLNSSFERLSSQVEVAREHRKIKRSSRNLQTSSASDQEYGTNIVSGKDLNLSIDSAVLFNTSTPYKHSKTKMRYSKKKTGRRKPKIVKSSLKFEQNEEQPSDGGISSKFEDTSLLSLSLPTPRPPRDISEPLR